MSPEDPFRRAGWAAWAVVAVLLVSVLGFCRQAEAQDATGARLLSKEACRSLADLVVMAAEARDTGARHQPYARLLARRFDREGVSEATRRIIYREVKRVFASPLEAEQHDLEVYTRCMTGPMGGTDT